MKQNRAKKHGTWSRIVIAVLSVLILFVSTCWMPMGLLVLAAQPKVMVTDYKIAEGKITAGDTFTLSLTIHNTSDRQVSNLKISVTSEGGELVPSKGAGTGYVAAIAADTSETFTFPMQASGNLEEKSYKLTVTTEYEDRYANPYTVTDTIYLPVTLTQRAEITGVYTEDSATLGDSVEILGSVSNLGTSTLYNVKAELQTEYLSDANVYVGNVEGGKNGSIDILANAVKTTPSGGGVSKIVVTYEDKAGNVTTMEQTITIEVAAPVYTDIEKVKDETTPDVTKTVVIVLVSIAAAAGIVVLAVRRHKRKKAILEEF